MPGPAGPLRSTLLKVANPSELPYQTKSGCSLGPVPPPRAAQCGWNKHPSRRTARSAAEFRRYCTSIPPRAGGRTQGRDKARARSKEARQPGRSACCDAIKCVGRRSPGDTGCPGLQGEGDLTCTTELRLKLPAPLFGTGSRPYRATPGGQDERTNVLKEPGPRN